MRLQSNLRSATRRRMLSIVPVMLGLCAAGNSLAVAQTVQKRTPVLVISDDVKRKDLLFITAALDPGGDAGFGTKLTVQTPSYLEQGQLDDFAAVVLADVARLGDAELAALEKRVSAGGGLLVFLGPQADAAWYNEKFYADGKGLLPAPLGKIEKREWTEAANIQASDHATFKPFAEKQQELLRRVYFARWHAVRDGWKAPRDGSVKRVAALEKTIPLIVEKDYGKGRALVVYTFPSEDWTQWQITPSWVVWLSAVIDYLTGKEPEAIKKK